MWKCHKCGKPVYFAERKQSLGYDWHPECLRCEECGKRLNPGQHAEHKGVPYCHVPCYGALFGPQLFGHGTRVESHTSFGKVENRSGGPNMPRSHLESKLKVFNQFYDGKSGEIRSREVNGRLVLEGALRIHWGVLGMIHLKEDDDQRTVVTIRKRNSCRSGIFNGVDFEVSSLNCLNVADSDAESAKDCDGVTCSSETCGSETSSAVSSEHKLKSLTLPHKLDIKHIDWDELDDLLQVERKVDEADKLYQTMPVTLPSVSSLSSLEGPGQTISAQPSTDATHSVLSEGSDGLRSNGCDLQFNNSAISLYEQRQNSSLKDSCIIERVDKQGPDITESPYGNWEKNLNRSLSGPDCLQRHQDRNLATEHTNFRVNHDSDASDEYEDQLEKALSEIGDGNNVEGFVGQDDGDNVERLVRWEDGDNVEGVVRRAAKTGSIAIRRRPGRRRSRTKLKRRCSINGHFYNRETSFFTPPHGSQMSVWITSLVNTQEVINLLLEKYKVDSKPVNFALFVVRDNGEQRRLRDDEYPLLVRVMLGPHEDVAKLFLMDRQNTEEISNEVAQFLNLSIAECRAILERYQEEEDREARRVRAKFREMRKRIKQRMEDLKKQLLEGKTLRLLWPNRVLYYDYSDEFQDQQKDIIEQAIYDLQRETCVRFVRRTTEPTYILLRNTNHGCASQVGYHPTANGIDLYLSSPGCLRTGTIQHELLHALGFWHEHTRPDRDAFISIFWDNIIPGRELNFRARTRYEPHEWLPYDYSSVMHYRAIAFSKDHLSATIVPKDRRAFFSIGQRVRYSPMDLAKLNVLYNCSSSYSKGDDVHSPLSEAGKDIASEQNLLSESLIEKGTLSAKSEKDWLSKSGTENNTFPLESGKDLIAKLRLENKTSSLGSEEDSSSEGLFSKPGLEKKTSPPQSKEDISSEGLFSDSGQEKKTLPRESVEDTSSADSPSKPKAKREICVSNFKNYLPSEENFFYTSERGYFIR